MAVKVNHVWFGDNPLGALEKFNVYSWRALGHEVTIYAHRWNDTPHDENSLELSGSGVTVENVDAILTKDDSEQEATLPNTRALLKGWIEATKQTNPSQDVIYNMADLTKSYIGGTRQGIVLDLKVGPSRHLADYEVAFRQYFVSYSRGRSTAGLPENQCIGTMQEADTLRGQYAASFESKITSSCDAMSKSPSDRHFDKITGFHGRSFAATRSNIDVANQAPGKDGPVSKYKVEEISNSSYGPFRVFKGEGDQSNRSTGNSTTPEKVADLCKYVWEKELTKNENADQALLGKVEEVLKMLPGYRA